MIKLIRNNQKKFVVGIAVVSMITFVYTGKTGGGAGGRDDHVVGTVAAGKPVLSSEVGTAHAELQAAEQFAPRVLNGFSGPQRLSLAQWMLVPNLELLQLRPDLADAIVRRPELLALLRREAVAAGIVADRTRAQGKMDDWLAGNPRAAEAPAAGSDEYDAVKAAVVDLLMVNDNFDRIAGALKASRPAVDRIMATREQTIQLNLVPVPADALLDKVSAPTPQQLDEQFKTYAAVAPDHADSATNPFSFGYRYPVRSRVQYLRLTRDAVEKAVAATKSDYDWDVAAAKAYYAHPDQFNPPTTAPSTPTMTPTVTPPSKAVLADALRQVRSPLVQALQDQVQAHLTSAMDRDWQAYATAVKGSQTPPAAIGDQPYDGRGYLAALAAQVQAKFNVRVDTDEKDDQSTKALAALPGLGTASASLASASSSAADGSLPRYVSDRATAYLKLPAPRPASAVVDLMQPSPPFAEATGDGIDIVRIASVKPDGPPANLDAVRSAVESDCRIVAAYALAKAQADKIAASAKDGLLLPSALAAGRAVVPTQPLTLQDVAVDGLKPPLEEAAVDFMKQAFGLLANYDPKANPHPAAVIVLPGQRRLIVAHLQIVNARWTTADYYQARLETATALQQQQAAAARIGWFNPASVIERVGYKASNAAQAADGS